MITKFSRFNKIYDLTYEDAIELGEYEKRIKNYFMEKYPETIINNKNPIFSLRQKFSATSIEKTLKFAKNHNDEILTQLVNEYLDKIENMKMEKDAKKYNL